MRGGDDLALPAREVGDVGLAQPPARLGVAAERADAGARRVDEHDIGLAAQRVELRGQSPIAIAIACAFETPARRARRRSSSSFSVSMSVATIRPRFARRAAIASVLPPAPAQ